MGMRSMSENFEIVVQRKEVFEKHRCFDKGWRGAGSTPEGRVVCCKECGRHWFVTNSSIYEGLIWKPVRWYHYRIRRAIVGK